MKAKLGIRTTAATIRRAGVVMPWRIRELGPLQKDHFSNLCQGLRFVFSGWKAENPSLAMLFEKFLRLHRRHAAGAGSGNRLPVTAVLLVYTGIDSVNPSEDVIVSFEVPIGIGVELAFVHLGIGHVTNAQKECAGGKIPRLA